MIEIPTISGQSVPDYALALVVAATRSDMDGVDLLLRGLTAKQLRWLTRSLVIAQAIEAREAAETAGVDLESFIVGMAGEVERGGMTHG